MFWLCFGCVRVVMQCVLARRHVRASVADVTAVEQARRGVQRCAVEATPAVPQAHRTGQHAVRTCVTVRIPEVFGFCFATELMCEFCACLCACRLTMGLSQEELHRRQNKRHRHVLKKRRQKAAAKEEARRLLHDARAHTAVATLASTSPPLVPTHSPSKRIAVSHGCACSL